MSDGAIVSYIYDGSFDGLLCCVHESVFMQECPAVIQREDETQLSLFEAKYITTNDNAADVIREKIVTAISGEALNFVKRSFLTCLEAKELFILNFIQDGFKRHWQIMNDVNGAWFPLFKAVRDLEYEAEAYRGFVRFSEISGALVSVIEPKNFVLPLLMHHFSRRYPDERLIIYDKTHRQMLICGDGKRKIAYIDEFEPAAAAGEELEMRRLWRTFYHSVGIKERYNPKCRMGHMPKRFWAQMTEFWESEAPVQTPQAVGETRTFLE